MSDDPIKDALKRMPYGFYAISSADGEGDVNIMVANWLMQVSFSPRLLALGLARKAYSRQLIMKGRVFGVNVFNRDDEDAIMGFTKSRDSHPDKVSSASYSLSPELNLPVVEGAAAHLELRVTDIVETGGDHTIVVGEVVGEQLFNEGDVGDTLSLPDIGWSYAG